MSRGSARAAVGLALLAFVRAGAAEPDAGVSRADEAFVVALVNSYRVGPVPWDVLIGSGINTGSLPGKLGPWRAATARNAKAPAAAGLVWDAQLAQAARASLARFAPAPEGSVHDPSPDLVAGGVAGSPAAALLLAEGGSNLRYVFAQAVLHCTKEVKGASGTTYVLARQQLVDPAFTACGVAVARVGAGYRLAIILADRPAARALSGVGFRDPNRNGLLDQGEPLVPMSVAIGGAPRAFPAGLWTLPLPAAGAVTATLTLEGHGWDLPLDAAVRTAWSARPVAEKADIDEARKLLDALAKAKPGAEVPDKAAFDLACRRPRLALDGATAAAVDQALVEVASVIERARRDLLDHLGDDKAAIAKLLAEAKRRWNGRGGAWIDFAKAYHQLSQTYGAWGRMEGEERAKAARALSVAIDQLAPKNADAVLWGQVDGWRTELGLYLHGVEHLAPPPATGGKKPVVGKP